MKNYFFSSAIILVAFVIFSLGSCDEIRMSAQSDSGVKKATVKVETDFTGQTIEQNNIVQRIKNDTKIGSIKHLYIVSSYTGTVLEYSTVKGKITSGGKRINPKTVHGISQSAFANTNYVDIGDVKYCTDEVMDEYGTYGESGNYLYWFDTQENYHQYYPSGGTYLHISDRPLTIKKASFSLEIQSDF